jgi:hypothetical protein
MRIRVQLVITASLTRIGDQAIDNAGMVHVQGDRMIKFQYLFQQSARDGRLPLMILRERKEAKLDLPVTSLADRLFRHLSEDPCSYFVFGPFVFAEASGDYLHYMATWVHPNSKGPVAASDY